MQALAGVDLQVREGEFVAVMGPSGSGKSTAMNILGCLDVPTGGAYRFRGVDVGALDRHQRALLRRYYLGFVFQGFNLLEPHLGARERRAAAGVSRRRRTQSAMRGHAAALDVVGLTGWEHHTPNELSGGQMQRVAIARAIVTEPSVLFADEPTGNLDTARSLEIMDLLVRFNRERGITIVMVTHEPDMAAYASRTITFRDGHVESDERGRHTDAVQCTRSGACVRFDATCCVRR